MHTLLAFHILPTFATKKTVIPSTCSSPPSSSGFLWFLAEDRRYQAISVS